MKGKDIINHATKAEMPDMEKTRENIIFQATSKQAKTSRLWTKYVAALSVCALLAVVIAVPMMWNSMFTDTDNNRHDPEQILADAQLMVLAAMQEGIELDVNDVIDLLLNNYICWETFEDSMDVLNAVLVSAVTPRMLELWSVERSCLPDCNASGCAEECREERERHHELVTSANVCGFALTLRLRQYILIDEKNHFVGISDDFPVDSVFNTLGANMLVFVPFFREELVDTIPDFDNLDRIYDTKYHRVSMVGIRADHSIVLLPNGNTLPLRQAIDNGYVTRNDLYHINLGTSRITSCFDGTLS